MAAQASAQAKRPTMEEILATPRSTFVDVAHMAWTPSKFPGVDVKILYQDETTGMLTVLTRMVPGSFIPLHVHTDIEQTYVLEGSLEDEQARPPPATSSGAPAATRTWRARRTVACRSRSSPSRTGFSMMCRGLPSWGRTNGAESGGRWRRGCDGSRPLCTVRQKA